MSGSRRERLSFLSSISEKLMGCCKLPHCMLEVARASVARASVTCDMSLVFLQDIYIKFLPVLACVRME